MSTVELDAEATREGVADGVYEAIRTRWQESPTGDIYVKDEVLAAIERGVKAAFLEAIERGLIR